MSEDHTTASPSELDHDLITRDEASAYLGRLSVRGPSIPRRPTRVAVMEVSMHWTEFLDAATPPGRYLPWKEVARRTSLSRTTAWRLQRSGEFPRSRPISPGRVGHLESEIEAWITSRAESGRTPSAPPREDRVADGQASHAPAVPPAARSQTAAARRSKRSTSHGREPAELRPEQAQDGQQIRFDF